MSRRELDRQRANDALKHDVTEAAHRDVAESTAARQLLALLDQGDSK
ncbi:MAG: hypothetical protein JNK05_34795 [Myxococcales bacterium]|nr:hypothetical protein [Myxococcales bacterium]